MAKILLVEDDKSLREIYGVRLMAEGYEIVSAGDGEEALAMAIKERPDLILSDVMMPKISGFDMLDILRSTSETKDVKVIMMTALSSDDQRARGEALGADRYLVKSQVGIEDVVRTVHDVLGDNVAPAPAAPSFPPAGTPMPASPALAPLPTSPAPTEPPVVMPEPPPMPAPEAAPTVQPAPQPMAQPVAPIDQSMPAPAPEPLPVTPPVMPELPPMPAPEITPVSAIPPEPVPTIQPTPMEPPIAAPSFEPTAQPAAPQPVAPPAPDYLAQPAVQLPQPTAPFSSPAPASLGDRVIQPLVDPSQASAQGDIASQMAQALNDPAVGQYNPPTPPAA